MDSQMAEESVSDDDDDEWNERWKTWRGLYAVW